MERMWMWMEGLLTSFQENIFSPTALWGLQNTKVPSVARPRLLLYSKDILLLFHWLLFLSSSQNPSFSERLEQFHLLNGRGLFFWLPPVRGQRTSRDRYQQQTWALREDMKQNCSEKESRMNLVSWLFLHVTDACGSRIRLHRGNLVAQSSFRCWSTFPFLVMQIAGITSN